MNKGMSWCTAAGAWGWAVWVGAQPVLAPDIGASLAPQEHHYHAVCERPEAELCTVKSPGAGLYTVLTPDVPFEDRVTHWVVDLRQLPPVKGSTKTLRVLSTTGDVHTLHLGLVYDSAVLARAAEASKAAKAAKAQISSAPVFASSSSTSETGLARKLAPEARVSTAERVASPSQAPADAVSASPAARNRVDGSEMKPVPPQASKPGLPVSQLGANSNAVGQNTPTSAPPLPTAAAAGGIIKPPSPEGVQKVTGTPTGVATEPPLALQAPCVDGICLGMSVQSLKAPFEAVQSAGEQLRAGMTLSAESRPQTDAYFQRVDAMFRKGDMDGFEKAASAWPGPSGFERDQARRNMFHLQQAYELAQQGLGGKRNADTVALATYFLPQSRSKKTGPAFALNLKADPMVFTWGSTLAFDQGLPKLFAKTKPVLCGVFRMEGYYESKSGYPTTVWIQSDRDGDLKVIMIERIFENVSVDSLQQLRAELTQRYAHALKAGIAELQLKVPALLLRLTHPVAPNVVGVGSREQPMLRQALWQQGWMDFKSTGGGIEKVMKDITQHQKAHIAACKPQALPLD